VVGFTIGSRPVPENRKPVIREQQQHNSNNNNNMGRLFGGDELESEINTARTRLQGSVILNRVEDEKMFVRICKVKSSGFREVE
jgi:hypothetical protein